MAKIVRRRNADACKGDDNGMSERQICERRRELEAESEHLVLGVCLLWLCEKRALTLLSSITDGGQ